MLNRLHWLPVTQRIKFKIATLTFKTLASLNQNILLISFIHAHLLGIFVYLINPFSPFLVQILLLFSYLFHMLHQQYGILCSYIFDRQIHWHLFAHCLRLISTNHNPLHPTQITLGFSTVSDPRLGLLVRHH